MSNVFRSARRTLAWSLIVASGLGGVVICRGIHPETLVAFRSLRTDFPMDGDSPDPQPPQHFALAASDSRLDTPLNLSTTTSGSSRPKVKAQPSAPDFPDLQAEHGMAEKAKTTRLPQLPPHPRDADPVTESPADGPMLETTSEGPATPATEGKTPTVEELGAPESPETPDAKDVARDSIPESVETSATLEKPVAPETNHSQPEMLAQLSQMQKRLDQLTSAQEQARQSQRALLDSQQTAQESKLQKQLDGIEASLKELKEKTRQQVAMESSWITRHRTTPRVARNDRPAAGQIVQDGPAGTDGHPRYSLSSDRVSVKELFDALAEKAHYNMVFSINVDGDVAINLKDVTADEALDAIRRSTGYSVEKNGRRIIVGPPQSTTYQRQEFLPPVVTDQPAGTKRR